MLKSLAVLSDRVSDYLGRLGLDADRNAEGIHLLRYGSTVVMISIFAHEDHVYARFAATVLVGAQAKLELVTRLLRLNTEVLFGAFLLFEDDTVAFAHTLLGDHLDYDAFLHVLQYVAEVSDAHDEELQLIGGGERAEDVLAEGDGDTG